MKKATVIKRQAGPRPYARRGIRTGTIGKRGGKGGRALLAAAVLAAMLLALFPFASRAAQEYSAKGATVFTFSDSGIAAEEGSSGGYKIEGTALTIEQAGTYLLTGSCTDGSVTVKKGTSGVILVLNGLTLTSADTAPLCFQKSTGVSLVVADGTKNALADSAKNNDESYPENTRAENAVIKCKDGSAVTVSGKGELEITANGKNGIKSGATTEEEGEASLCIRELTLQISAGVNDAINAEQLLNIESGTLTVSAADDAIHCDLEMNIGAQGAQGPTINITQCYEGLEAATLNILSGNIFVTAEDDCLNAANADLENYAFSMNLSGGVITAFSADGDGFDSNGTLTISGGTITVFTANTADNEPLDADGEITVLGGTVLAAGGSRGMGMQLTATQGCVIFGESAGAFGGFAGGGMPNGEMSGGDMPGGGAASAELSGGESGQPPEKPDKEAESERRQSGGAPGDKMPGGFGQGFGGSVLVQKGQTLTVTDDAGNALCSVEAPCDLSYVMFSAAELSEGESYTLCADGTSAAEAQAESGSVAGANNGSGTPWENPRGTEQTGQADGSDGGQSDESGTNGGTGLGRLWWAFALCVLGGAGAAALCIVLILKRKTAK